MKRKTGWLAGVVLSAMAGGAFYLWQQSRPTLQEPMLPTQASPATAEPPALHYPVPPDKMAKELPALDGSDPTIWMVLADIMGEKALKQLFHSERIVRNIVVTVDNLPRQTAAARLLPVKPAPGSLRVVKNAQSAIISSDNPARYAAYMKMMEALDARELVEIYYRYYPLFQSAYRELGYPEGHFNDRLIAVLDHLLAAPQIEGPITVVQPHILYRFADPELEAASSGHKILLRIGDDNARRVKTKLQAIRRELAQNPQPLPAATREQQPAMPGAGRLPQ